MKLLSEEDEDAILQILANEIPSSVLTSFPALLRSTGSALKKTYLCPNCGKMLSGLTSLKRHLVRDIIFFRTIVVLNIKKTFLNLILDWFHS